MLVDVGSTVSTQKIRLRNTWTGNCTCLSRTLSVLHFFGFPLFALQCFSLVGDGSSICFRSVFSPHASVYRPKYLQQAVVPRISFLNVSLYFLVSDVLSCPITCVDLSVKEEKVRKFIVCLWARIGLVFAINHSRFWQQWLLKYDLLDVTSWRSVDNVQKFQRTLSLPFSMWEIHISYFTFIYSITFT